MNVFYIMTNLILSPITHIFRTVISWHQRDIARDIYVSNKEKGWFSNNDEGSGWFGRGVHQSSTEHSSDHNHSSIPCIPEHISCFPSSLSCSSCCTDNDPENISLIGNVSNV